MALTIVEAAKLSNDILQRGVLEKLVYQDPILGRLQFKDVEGNGLTYNVETTMSGAQFYGVNEKWNESTSVVTPSTANLAILGGDADVDNFLKATRSNFNDLMQEQIEAKAKAIKKMYMEMFFYGYYNGGSGADLKGFDGLHALIKSQGSTATIYDNVVSVANTSGTGYLMSMSQGEKAKDMIKDDTGPDLCIMSKAMRRAINKYLNGVGGITKSDIEGKSVQTMWDTPVAVSDYIKDWESAATNYGDGHYGHDYTQGWAETQASVDNDAATSIFFVKFAPEAVCGIQRNPLTIDPPIQLETKDGTRRRLKWYCGLMLQKIILASKVTGVLVAGTHTA